MFYENMGQVLMFVSLRRYDWLSFPHNVEQAPEEHIVRKCPHNTPTDMVLKFERGPGHPHRDAWHQMGRRFRERFHPSPGEAVEPEYTTPPHGSCRVQVCRSVSDWSHGVLTEHSIQNACECFRRSCPL
jgi:phospholipase D1/2